MKQNNQWAAFIFLLVIGVGILQPTIARKNTKVVDGKRLFEQHCASCHTDGGNKVNIDKPVAGSKVLVTLASFKNYLERPPGHMPYYQDVVGDEAVLKALYGYCKSLKVQPTKQACL